MTTHYQPSENIDPVRTAIGVIVGLALITLLSFGYNAIISFVPIIYLSVVAPIGYAILLGLLTRAIAHFGKFRSRKKGIALAVFLGLAANYTQWYAYLDFAFVQDFEIYFDSYLRSLFGGLGWGEAGYAIAGINEYGTWSVGAAGYPVNGIVLTLVWIIEFLLILLYPVWTIRNKRSRPFSEEQDRYYDQFMLDNLFQPVYTPAKAELGLSGDPLAYLRSVELNQRHPGSRVEVYFLPNENNAYISMLRTRVDEKNKEVTVPVVEEIRINSRDARLIMEAYHHTRDPLNVFGD